jgi:tetratricopeptide (TPR) repeat protein
MGRQVFRATRRFFTDLARARPVVLAIEDLHWADASTIALIQHILRATADAPLLAIGTSRPDPSSPAAELRLFAKPAPRYTEVILQPLTDAQTAVLIGNLLAVDDLPERLRDVTLRKAEGNPLYVEEIIRSLVDTGVVRREESTGRWRAAADAADIDLPDTIGGLILARLDRLDDRAKHVLRHAAVIGRSFRERLLKALQPDEDLDPVIASLLAHDVLVERRRSADPEHMFKHVVIQQTVYESITKKQRRELHAMIANTIVATYSDRLDEFVGALAYHYARAEQWDEAYAYLERAGDQAGRVAADADAVERYRDAITAYGATGRGSALQLASLERKLGEALFRRGAHVEATISLRSALGRLGVKFPSSRGATTRALVGQALVQSGHLALPWLLPTPGLRIDPVVDERMRAYETLAWIDHFGGNARRQALVSLRMLNDCERSGHLPGLNQGLLGTAIMCDALALSGLADRYHRRNVALAEKAKDPTGIGYAYFGLAYHEHGIGNWDESGSYWARGTEAFWSTRDLRRWGIAMWAVGMMKWRRGAPAGTKEIGEQMLQVADEGADSNLRGWALAVVGRAQWTLGAYDDALRSLRESAAILRDVPDRVILVRTLGDIGVCLLRRGDLPAATKVLEEAQQLVTQYEVHGYHAQLLHWRLEVYLEHWQRASATERALWVPKIDDALRTVMQQARFDIEARPGQHRLQGRLAWLQGRHAEAEADWRMALELAEKLRFIPELAWIHAEMGWWLNSREHVDRASELFDGMGSRGELARLNAMRTSAQQR